MQIKHLSAAKLQPAGQLLPAFPEGDLRHKKQQLMLTAAPQIPQYIAGDRTVLDYVSGMSVLVIYQDDRADCFCLDRVVALLPGIRFSVLPMGEHCCVDILHAGDELLPVGYIPISSLETPVRGLQFQRLYTVLYQEFPHDFYFRGEQHLPYELVYVNQGTLHNLVRGQDILLPRQHFMIIDSNDWHTQYSDLGVSFLTVSFWSADEALSGLTNRSFSATPPQQALFQSMLGQNQQEPYANDRIEALLKLLLIELLQGPDPRAVPSVPKTTHAENTIVDQAIRIISENIHKKLTLEELSALVHVSVPYLYKLFQLHLGTSPGKYITKIRIEECKVLLRDGQLTMGQIAQKLGFSSLQHFSRQFKNICGVSPSQYIASLQ